MVWQIDSLPYSAVFLSGIAYISKITTEWKDKKNENH